MYPSLGWSTVGAEQNVPDTVNNILFGNMEDEPIFPDFFHDPLDDSSSVSLRAMSRSEDPSTHQSEIPLLPADTINLPILSDVDAQSGYFGDNPSYLPPSIQTEVGLVNEGFSNQLPLNSMNSMNSVNSVNSMDVMDTPQSANQGYPVNQANSTNPPVSYPSINLPSNAPQLLSTPSLTIPPMDLPTVLGNSQLVDRRKAGTKKQIHNTSEKRRVERMNLKIEELHSIITSTGTVINKSKINVLMETIRLIKHLQNQIQDLQQQTKVAEEKANKRMGRVNEVVQSQKINYHALFLQSPVPTALLSTDGQFVDANSQFCTLTKTTMDSLKTMTLFRLTHHEDLPCAFGSYSYMLHSKLDNPSQCIIRHCVIGGNVRPVYFSLSLIRNKNKEANGFICTILPVLSCECTGRCNPSRHCSGELISPQGNKYLICNPPDTIPCCSKLVGALAGEVSADEKQCPAGC